MGKRILVIGGSGFIGTHLCIGLKTRGFKPIILDRVAPTHVDAEFHQCDMSNVDDSWSTLLDSVEALYYLAWTTKPQSANDAPLYDLQTNVVAGLRLLDMLALHSKPPRMVFVSTGGAIYGRTTDEKIGEEHPTFPLNAYGVSKLAFEHYLRLYRHLHNLDYLVFRPSNPYGEFQDPLGNQGAVGVFLGRLAKGEEITVWGDGSVIRDYLYVGDLVTALLGGLDYIPGDAGPRVFNVGSGRGIDLRQLIVIMSRITGRTAQIVYTNGRKTDAPRIILDIGRICERLNWKPTTDIENGLTRTWQWILSLGL